MTKKCICAALTEPECDCGAVDYGEREWVGLTEEETDHLFNMYERSSFGLVRAVEAKLKEKNT